MKKRLFLTFGEQHADRPILSLITSRFGCEFSIIGATVDETTRFFAIEVQGEGAQIEAVGAFLVAEGVHLEAPDDG